MKTEDGNEALHPWIEPELEARLTALVLGEASDFERDELERLVAERPELGLYRKRLEVMHQMLHEVASGESGEDQGDWKLAPERRGAVLARLEGETAREEKVVVMSTPRKRSALMSRLTVAVAIVAISGLFLALLFSSLPGVQMRLERKSVESGFAYGDNSEASEKYNEWYFREGAQNSTHAQTVEDERPGIIDLTASSSSAGMRSGSSPIDGGEINSELRRFQPAQNEWNHYPGQPATKADADLEATELALADQAIRPAISRATPQELSADPMVVTRSGQFDSLKGTAAIGAGGDIALGIDPNSPGKLSVTTSGNSYPNVRVGGSFDGRVVESPPLAEKPVTSTLGGENTYTGGTEISAGGGALAITSPELAAGAPAAGGRELGKRGHGQVVAIDVPKSDEKPVMDNLNISESELAVREMSRNAGKADDFGAVTLGHAGTANTPALAASPKPIAAAPVSGPTVADPEARLAKTGAGTLALNGGTGDLSLGEEIVEFDGFIDHKTKTGAPQSAPSARENLNFTGDMQVSGGVEAKANAAKESLSLGSGGMIAGVSGQAGRDGFGNESPDKQDALSRSTGSGVATGQEGDVSRMGRSVAVEKSMSQQIESEVKRERTGDWGKAPVGKAPIDETVDLGGEISAGYMSDYIFHGTRFQADGKNVAVPKPGTVNFGAATSTIEALSGFVEVTEASSPDPATTERLKEMRYLADDGADANDLATAESDFELPGLQSDKQRYLFSVQAGSQRTDAEVEIGEPWTFGRAGEVEKSMEESLTQGLDLADTSRTKDQVIRRSASPTSDIAHRIDKLKTIIIPSVEFNDTPLRDALEFLQERSVELDLGETDPARKGIQIVADTGLLHGGEREAAETEANKSGGFGFEPNEGSAGDTRISLRLSNVPLAEALRYTTSLAQLKYKVEQNAVRIVPVSTPDADLFTNVYTVPPTFLSVGDAAAAGGGSAGAADPFANPVSAGATPAPGGRTTAKQILERAGISFPEGASAIYNAETSQLIVRNTPDQTELVEAFVDSVAGSEENEGEHLFTRHFLGGAESLRGFDDRDVGERSEVDKSVQDILALTPQVNTQTNAGGTAWYGSANSAVPAVDKIRFATFYDVGEVTNGPATTANNGDSDTNHYFATASDPNGGFNVKYRLTPIDPADPTHSIYSAVVREAPKPTPAALAETSPSAEPFSTFSLHVSDVSFQLAKSSLASGKWPEAEKIRIEEFVNAFDYGDPVPSMDERVACRIDQGAHPFLQQRNLVRIALRTAEAGRSSGTPLRLTLLLDSSGSMERPDRRATLTRAVATLAGLLGENDRITLVSFARQPRLVADAVAGNEAMQLAETVASLPSEGGTNLEAALELAFEKAREHQEANAQNRIVLLTDGAANLGDAKAESLGARVEMMREAGIAFDAAGFGAEGLNDEILEALTRKGDGRYYLLDRPEDAGEAFAEQIAGALRPAAKNVKVQVEFNPDRVKSYKLLGFEKHRLATEDFRNDAVDAAELAAAEAGVAVYQVEPNPAGEGDLGSVSVRFRDLESGEMIERRWSLPHLAAAPAPDQGGDEILLATVASQFAAKLAGGPIGDVVDLGELARLAAALPESERVKELRTMIEQARGLEGDR